MPRVASLRRTDVSFFDKGFDMAKKPTDLTSAAWNKLKEVTVPKTGFGAKLDAYDVAKKKTEALTTRNLQTFGLAAVALGNITKHIPDAQKKCNKTLHKDTIAALEAYKPLIAAESTALNKAFIKYQGNIDRTLQRLTVCEAAMKVHKQTMTALVKSSVDSVTNAVAAKKKIDAVQLVKSGLTALRAEQDKTNTTLEKWREPVLHADAAHVDDRPDDAAFQRIIKMQKEISDMRANADNDLAKALKTLSDALPAVPKTPAK